MTWGRVVTDSDVADAVEASLRHWLPSAVAELARRAGRGPTDTDLPGDRSWWRTAPEEEVVRDATLPAVMVSARRSELVRKHDTHDGIWQAKVVCVVRSGSHRSTADLAALYASAVELAVQQDYALLAGTATPFSTDVWVSGEHEYREVSPDTSRTALVAEVGLEVHVDDVLTRSAGPRVPPPLPSPPEDPAAPGPWQPPVDRVPVSDVQVTVSQRQEP